jgi:hypothetical protein
VKWAPLLNSGDYKVNIVGVSINNHYMAGSDWFHVGFIESGTTFSYFPTKLFDIFIIHFDWFCGLDTSNHCKGKRIYKEATICFTYDEKLFVNGPKDYFSSYPILKFHIKTNETEPILFNWYPSEYLYLEKPDQYCMAAEG